MIHVALRFAAYLNVVIFFSSVLLSQGVYYVAVFTCICSERRNKQSVGEERPASILVKREQIFWHGLIIFYDCKHLCKRYKRQSWFHTKPGSHFAIFHPSGMGISIIMGISVIINVLPHHLPSAWFWIRSSLRPVHGQYTLLDAVFSVNKNRDQNSCYVSQTHNV